MKIITILCCLFLSATAFTQDYDFGKVSKEELQEKFNPLDSTANATYLYKYRKTYYEYIQGDGFRLVTDIHERLKIYNQEGFDYATIGVSLYKHNSDNEEVNALKAYTYNLISGKIEDTKLDKKGIFKTEKSIYRNETKFTMPNIKEGSVIEYEYRINSPFYHIVDEFVFQHDIPIKKLVAKIEVPEFFNFKANTKGFLQITPKHEVKGDKITFDYKTRSIGGVTQTNYDSNDLEFTKNISSYNLSNIPALKEESYVNNISNYRSAVKYELSYTKFPNSTMEFYSTTWEDVVKTIYRSSDFGVELKKSGYYINDIDSLISSVSDPMKKAFLIFNYVKSRVKWNGYYGKYTKDGVKKAYKDQVGNVAEINLMLTSMLRYAGLRANPVLVSTRQNGIPLFPTREGYNYVISGLEIQDDIILFDATSRNSSPNVLPFRTLNWEGRIIKKDGTSKLINLYPKDNSKTSISMMLDLGEEGTIDGSFRSIKTNHFALSYRERFNETNEDDFLEKLENRFEGIEVTDFKVTNAVELSKPIMESYKFAKESQADIIGDRIYFSPLFHLRTTENPFKLEKREFPVDFGYPSKIVYRITINLPKGYKIESLPEPIVMMLPDNLGEFRYNLSGNKNAIQAIISTHISVPIISSIYYDGLKAYFNGFIQKEAEQIVLTRI